MSRPKSMVGAPVTVKVNGVDVKDYGMVINEVPNGTPPARSVEEVVPLKHGSIDNTRVYESKNIAMTGQIAADSAAGLVSNIDELKELFRLRADATLIEIEFQNRTGYVWQTRLVSFVIGHPASWYAGTTATFTLTVKAVEPFSQATSGTTASGLMNVGKIQTIAYAGTGPTPLDINIKGRDVTNLLYNVSDALGGWTAVNAALATAAASTQFPAMYQTYNLKSTRSGAGNFGAYRDILPLIATGKYYVASVYLRVQTGSSNDVRLNLKSDSGNIQGTAITNFAYIARSFLKIEGATYDPTATYARFQVESDDGNSVMLWDGCSVNEITLAEYNDADYEPVPYTDDVSLTTYSQFTPILSITGKNLCPAGAKDLDVAKWVAGNPKTIWDVERNRVVIVSIGSASNARLRSAHFRLDPGQYTLSFRYKPVTSGSILYQIMAIGESTAGKVSTGTWDGSYFDGHIVSEALSVASEAWQTKSRTFTVGKGVEWIALTFYDNGGTDWEELRLAEIQVESGTSQTRFENYRAKTFRSVETIEENEKLIVGSANGQVLHINQDTGEVENAMDNFIGEFFELLPGTNNILLHDKRAEVDNPQISGSGALSYDLIRRDRYL